MSVSQSRFTNNSSQSRMSFMAIIGKNVIENLTTAMYEDLRIIYREYVQNAADSIDKAIKQGLLRLEEARIEINIDANKRYVSVRDNGTGISCDDFLRKMSRIADSEKDRAEDKGFRGIGRLGGISSCKTLKFSCSVRGEQTASVCVWDAQQVRDILVDEKQNPSAGELVDMVTTYSQDVCDIDEHFFLVELIDIEQSSAELLDKDNVQKYLEAVAPIPYATGFTFKSKIAEFARQNGFTIDEYQVFINGERLFKPYSRKLYEPHNHSKKAYDELSDVKFEIFKDTNGETIAWMWYGVSKFEKQIPAINPMRGIRLRKANIQIGNENTFSAHDFYKEPRGCLYFVGEVFAVGKNLIPNARRDYFNLNDTCRLFERTLRPLFYDTFYTIYHRANEYKKALQKQSELQATQQEHEQRMASGGFIDAEDQAASEKKIEELKKAAERAAKTIETREQKEATDQVLGRVYSALRSDYAPSVDESGEETPPQSKPCSEKPKGYMTQSLSKYNRKEQKLISRIYSILKAILPHDTAEIVISKIQEELSK
ncbi:ATP-binding protein [Acutalibacter sp. 1XD8-33]|nr:ATP-binding protein [Acutalibacter sp. 1XD8-33]